MFVVVGNKLDTIWAIGGSEVNGMRQRSKFKKLIKPLSFIGVSRRIYWICTLWSLLEAIWNNKLVSACNVTLQFLNKNLSIERWQLMQTKISPPFRSRSCMPNETTERNRAILSPLTCFWMQPNDLFLYSGPVKSHAKNEQKNTIT